MIKPTHCQGCGKPLDQSGTRNPKRWCSERCRIRTYRATHPEYLEAQAQRAKELAAKREASRPPRRRCENCGKELKTRHPRAKYCSGIECKRAAERARLAHSPKCMVDGCDRNTAARGLCSGHYGTRWKHAHPERAKEIAGISRRKRRALISTTTVEPVSLERVLERDGWKCGICGKRIPKNSKWPDAMSASLDHIVPLSRGGAHTMVNVQAAHYGCNARKNSTGAGDQLAIFG
ncbi:HNH endonuclease [Corynebacterium striatum]|uniref:HNH endonuclease n=1 Tax=Corynebacterium striatum TaxID=43770 RepID=UPI000D724B46|nr:hypothetical protein CKF74_07245 [Corynebacterium striatum]